MKIQIDIITGFLDSGKTAFLNEMLENEALSEGEIVILQLESGQTEIDDKWLKNKKIAVKKFDTDISDDELKDIIEQHSPDRIIIEYNGMKPLNSLFEVLEEKYLRKSCICNRIINIVDVNTFDLYMNNIGSVYIEQISSCDLIVLNKIKDISAEKLNSIEKTIKALNKSADIVREIFADEQSRLYSVKKLSFKSGEEVRKQKLQDGLLYIFFGLSALFLLYTVLSLFDFAGVALSWLQSLNTVFLSILMQAVPFILIGILVSSVLQVVIPGETLLKIFPQKKGIGFITAIFAGVLFPVCDCAIIPVAARLIKKGVALPVAITFMLAAPLVNPVVIASTLYAFPKQPSIAVYRVIFGALVALVAGMVFLIFPEKKSIIVKNLGDITCSCEYCSSSEKSGKGPAEKIKLVFIHASTEFFQVGKFLIIGAFFSSVFQTCVSKDIFNNVWGHDILALLVMMLAAFIFSICSTSDAFIARTFMPQFSANAILGFLVLGPMIDIKNMLMLLASFRKGFVIRLIAVVFAVTFFILYLQALIIK
ncbi:hypothetical protein LY28_00871 [Ruminiclostridium sufflavum DSM 19573]|uniref:CobW/HypB/UreG nucleotide-binding domain-containing protein n=1 Tax=Ruminiclostridium sufflavum DSM 19573 TaxID=1121337 RepID=A0A318XPF2_9FIRM|nr:permease [Ruminiclostridium sufflavum]PYG89050.1 hypothetical protein LY28_00871 [Ruminiclostridium sufflavum DSM 19573]